MKPMKYKFNPICDIEPVSQTGFLDLADAFKNNAIPADLSAVSPSYNNIDEPGAVSNRPRDVFDEIAMRDSYRKYVQDYSKREK